MKRVYKFTAAATLMALGSTVPVIPKELPILYTYQTTYDAQLDNAPRVLVPNPEVRPVFQDDDGNGVVSVAVFLADDGSKTYEQIPDALYGMMGEKDGIKSNPHKTVGVSVLDEVTPKASAAITVDSGSQANLQSAGKVISLTMAATVAGANSVLMVQSFNNDLRAGVTGTYNGSAMTVADSRSDGSALYNYLFYLKAPSAGTNNVVLTVNAAATDLWIRTTNFNGLANQAATSHSGSAGTAGTATETETPTTDNSLHVLAAVNENGAIWSAGAGTQVSYQPTDGGAIVGSSPYAITPAVANTLTITATSPAFWALSGATFAPASAAVATPQSIINFE